MDPISAISLAATIGSCIREVVELCIQLRTSVQKVGKNQAKLRRLSDDVLATVYGLQELYGSHKTEFEQSPELVRAVQCLKDDLLLAYGCYRKSLPSHGNGRFAAIQAKIKAYKKRDDVEEELQRLKEQVSACYAKFTVFSAARIESNSVRMEHQLVVTRFETHSKLEHLDVLVTQLLLDTPAGNQMVQKIVCNIDMTSQSESVEIQFLKYQFAKISESLDNLSARRQFAPEHPDAFHFTIPVRTYPNVYDVSDDLVVRVLAAKRLLVVSSDNLSVQEGARTLLDLATAIPSWYMNRERIWATTRAVQLYRLLARGSPEFLPWVAHSTTCVTEYQLQDLASSSVSFSDSWTIYMGSYICHANLEKPLSTAEDACRHWQVVCGRDPTDYNRLRLADSLTLRGSCLWQSERLDEAVSSLERAVSICRDVIERWQDDSSLLDLNQLSFGHTRFQFALIELAKLSSCHGSRSEALSRLYQCIEPLEATFPHTSMDATEWTIVHCLAKMLSRRMLRLVDVEDMVDRVRALSRRLRLAVPTYVDLFQRLSFVCSMEIGDDGTIVPLADDAYGEQNPFWKRPSAWQSDPLSNIPPLLKDYMERHGVSVRDILGDMFHACCGHHYDKLNFHLVQILAQANEEEAIEAFEEAVEGAFPKPYSDLPALSASHALRFIARFQFAIGNPGLANFSSVVLDSGRMFAQRQRTHADPESESVRCEMAVTLRIWSGMLKAAGEGSTALEYIELSLAISMQLSDCRYKVTSCLNLRSDCHLSIGRYEECLADVREAYDIAWGWVEAQGKEKHFLAPWMVNELRTFVQRLVQVVYFPATDELLGVSAHFLEGLRYDPHLTIYQAYNMLCESLLTVALRAQTFRRWQVVLQCIQELRRLWTVRHHPGDVPSGDSTTIATAFFLLSDMCLAVPVDAVAEIVDEAVELRKCVNDQAVGDAGDEYHPIAWISTTSHVRRCQHGSPNATSIFSIMGRGLVPPEPLAGLICTLERRAVEANPSDAVILRRHAVKLCKHLWDSKSSPDPLENAKAESLKASLRSLIKSLYREGNQDGTKLETYEDELHELSLFYPDLDVFPFVLHPLSDSGESH